MGDGVYVDQDARGVVLTTENGYEVTNTIVLESDVFGQLLVYLGIDTFTTVNNPHAVVIRREGEEGG